MCLLLSAGIWLIHNLSLSYVTVVSMPVVAFGNLDGRSVRSTNEATVTAQVKATGFRQAALSRSRKNAAQVTFNNSDFKYLKGDVFSIPSASIYKYASEIFGPGASIETVVSGDLQFTFPQVSFKKVPIRPVQSLSFASQYTATRDMTLKPDSVLVYGEQYRLDNVDYVLTRPVVLKDLDGSAHGSVRLEVPTGVRLSVNEAVYDLEVSRYVEIRSVMKIETRNVPEDVDFSVLPSSATVVFRCIFPTTSDPASKAVFYVDYNDFVSSMSGRCVPKCEGLPGDVIDYKIDPAVFDCLVKSQ